MSGKDTYVDRLEAVTERDMVEELILAYRPLVFAAARRLHPGDPLDEDLLQCGLIGLWKAAERWDGARPFGPLARHCVRSEMVDHLRRVGRWRREASPDDLPRRELRRHDVHREDFDAVGLRDAVARTFPQGSRERALLLALLDGVSLPDAAKALGLRRGRCRDVAARAWMRLEREDGR